MGYYSNTQSSENALFHTFYKIAFMLLMSRQYFKLFPYQYFYSNAVTFVRKTLFLKKEVENKAPAQFKKLFKKVKIE